MSHKYMVVVRHQKETRNFKESPHNLKNCGNVRLKKTIAKLFSNRFTWDSLICVCYGQELSTDPNVQTATLKSLMEDNKFGKKIEKKGSLMINCALQYKGGK